MGRLTEVAGRVALVTGASAGIGAAAARTLARRGARVALVARRRERLEELAAEIARGGGEAIALACDVGRAEEVEAAAQAALEAFGRIDLLVNSAGYATHVQFVDQPLEDVERLLRVNYLGTVYAIRAVLPAMRRAGQGWIVNVSSFAGKVGQPDEAAYSAAKFAVTGLSEALVHELGPLGLHVLCVHPVLVRTEMFDERAMARLPARMRDAFIGADELVDEVLRALARGKHDVTVPRRYAGVYLLRNLFPGPMRRKMGEVKMEPVRRLGAEETK